MFFFLYYYIRVSAHNTYGTLAIFAELKCYLFYQIFNIGDTLKVYKASRKLCQAYSGNFMDVMNRSSDANKSTHRWG